MGDANSSPQQLCELIRERNRKTIAAFRLQDGDISTFRPEGLRASPTLLADADGDGRPDAIFFPSEVSCDPDHPEGKCTRVYGDVSLDRSRPDGTFEPDPALAERYQQEHFLP